MSEEGYRVRTENEDEILRCVVGSRAYGVDDPSSDWDFKGIFVPPVSQILGVAQPEKTRRYSEDDQSYSLRHYIMLCVKSVPNSLELLFCEEEDVVLCLPEGRLLRNCRNLFLTRNCVAPYLGYSARQLAKSAKKPMGRGAGRQDIIAQHGFDTKFAYHTLRLMQTAEELFTEGVLRVRRPNGAWLRDVRNGKVFRDYTDFHNYATDLLQRVEALKDRCPLRVSPDMAMIHKLTASMYQTYWARTRQV